MASRLLWCLPVLFLACAENRLHTYMVVEKSQGTGSEKSAAKKGEIRLSAPPLKLTMYAPEGDDLENLADDLRLSAPSKYHRLPALTILRFDFENRTALPWKIDLGRAYFAEPSGKKYAVIGSKAYTERFTSVAYEHFKYDAMYAIYITRRGADTPKDTFFFDRKKPEEGVELMRGEAGFQILPFEFIPAGVENLTLHFPGDNEKMRQVKIKLTTERGQ
ncbi:MAG: hypothetical protein U1F27_06470 [Turneriella sp.]